jgi:hypothetical protein
VAQRARGSSKARAFAALNGALTQCPRCLAVFEFWCVDAQARFTEVHA